jgi:hypothetical protein
MNPKDLRKQLRNVAKELLPEILTQAQFEELKRRIDEKLAQIEKDTKATMHTMNERHKDTMSYLVRQVSKPIESKAE